MTQQGLTDLRIVTFRFNSIGIGKWKLSSMMCFILLISLFTIFHTASAQSPIMRIFAITPDWNGKQFCDNGSGYDPGPINAPSMSYSGKDIQEASYTYSWEQQVNQGGWTVVASGQGRSFVPSYNPPVLHYIGKSMVPVTYSWRLKVKDVANGSQLASTETYQLTLGVKPVVTFTTSATSGAKNKVNIDLKVSGGFNGKVFTWSTAGGGENVPEAQQHVEDPGGLAYGVYTVLVDDKVCSSIKKNIDTNASSPKTND